MDIEEGDQARGLFLCVSEFIITQWRWRWAYLVVQVSASPQDKAETPMEHCSHSLCLNRGSSFYLWVDSTIKWFKLGPRHSSPPVGHISWQEIAVPVCTHSHLSICDKESRLWCAFTAVITVSGCSGWPVHIIWSSKARLLGNVSLLFLNQVQLLKLTV